MIALTASELQAIGLSVKVAAMVCLCITGPAISFGWFLARHTFPGKAFIDGIVSAPLVIPPVVTGYILLLLCGRNGWLGFLFHAIGLPLVFAWQGAVLASAVVAFPLAVRSIRLAIAMVDPRYEEAAHVLGFSRVRTFFTIVLPLSWPGITGGLLLAFARSLGEFGATMTFAGNVPGVTQTLPLAIYSSLQVPGGERQALLLSACSLILCISSMGISGIISHHARAKASGISEA